MTTPINSFQDILNALERDLGCLVGEIYKEGKSRIADRLVRRDLGLMNPAVVMAGLGANATHPMPEIDEGCRGR